ncbi:MAG: SurA N-terminal domain-containing protein [Proteobacteria bacterium]|nr:SurA N-terminal domain-containing protein [Pseudomonadota bacterium]
MLQKIRDASSGWFAGLILGPLIVLFGLWGINGYFQGRNDTYAARITVKPGWFGSSLGAKYKDISTDDFRARFERERQDERQRLGDNFDQATFDTPANKHKVADMMVMRELLLAAAERDGMAVSGQQLYDAIANDPTFQVDGKFDQTRYLQVLSILNPPRTPEQYQALRHDDLLVQSLAKEITLTGLTSEKEIDFALRLAGQKRDLRYVALPMPAQAPVLTDAQIDAWYKAHTTDYRTQEQVALEYLEIDGAALPPPTGIDEASLRQRYDDQKDRYLEPEQRRAAHILLNVPANATPAQEKAVQAKAAALAIKARAPGADFAAMAKADSDDIGSKNQGGDLGWLTEKAIDQKPFATALFALKPGQVSDPVRTAEGWHVILLREVKDGNRIPFAQVHDQIQADAIKEAREKQFSDLSGKLVDLTLKDPTTLATAAKTMGMTVQKTPLFPHSGGPGIAANPAVIRAAFSRDLIDSGENSDEIDLDKKNHQHMVVIRVAEHVPVKTLPLAQVRDRVITAIQADARDKAEQAAADSALASLKKGESLDALATSLGVPVQTLAAVERGQVTPSADLIDTAFRQPHPQDGKPLVSAQARLSPSQLAVLQVTRVVDGDPSSMDAATRENYRKQFAQQARGGLEVRNYIDALRKQFQVKIADDRL